MAVATAECDGATGGLPEVWVAPRPWASLGMQAA